MSDDVKAESDSYNEWLWNLPVEEFKRLRESDDPNDRKPYVPPVPVDVAGRFRALQDLLHNDGEFEARFPAAFQVLFPRVARRREPAGLYLPSFDVRILNNWVHPHVRQQSSAGGADAHSSVSRWWQKDWRLHEANRGIGALPFDDLQGILLAILGREESGERVDVFMPGYRAGDVEGVHGPEESFIRLTDLRLAELVQPDVTTRALKPLLDLLHRPLSRQHVVMWKLYLLGGEPEHYSMFSYSVAKHLARIPAHEVPEELASYVAELTELRDWGGYFLPRPVSRPVQTKSDLLIRRFGSEEVGIAAVSFTAAALWLFLDLDMPGVESASSYRLVEQVESLASIVCGSTQRLRRSTEELGKLIANRSSGNHPELPGNNHLALQQYRMGYRDLRQIAEWLGITPYSSRTGKGTRDWKARVKKRLNEGNEFEKQNYPRAAAIFTHRDHPAVRRKARRAYRGYLLEKGRYGSSRFFSLGRWAHTNAAETNRGREIVWAYCQLGSCIIQRIPLLP